VEVALQVLREAENWISSGSKSTQAKSHFRLPDPIGRNRGFFGFLYVLQIPVPSHPIVREG